MTRSLPLLVGLGLVTAFAGAAHAQDSDPVVEQARAAGTVGEQADGYLGIAKAGSSDLKGRVDAINIKRRAIYTDLAAKRGVTVQEVAAATACELLQSRVPAGGSYRLADGNWQTRSGTAQVTRPDYCK